MKTGVVLYLGGIFVAEKLNVRNHGIACSYPKLFYKEQIKRKNYRVTVLCGSGGDLRSHEFSTVKILTSFAE